MPIEVISKRIGGYKGVNIEVIIDISRTSPVGNPYPVGKYGRDKCIQRFTEAWPTLMTDSVFASYIQNIAELNEQGKRIGLECWCAPDACHGDVIKRKVEELCTIRPKR